MTTTNSKNDFIPPSPLEIAVLFIVFNRLETTKSVFQAIRKARPPRLYISADGARKGKDGEAKKVAAVRRYVMENIDWNCEVKTQFSEENLGCKYGEFTSMDWFFKNEEMGIILEDDNLPSQSFFWFCETLLKKYQDDTRVGHISGTNLLGKYKNGNHSYHFSNFGASWGWAGWRRAWKYYDVDMRNFPLIRENRLLRNLMTNQDEYESKMKAFENAYKGKDTWDYQWSYTRLLHRMLSIIPSKNLISNLGFGEGATHTHDPQDIFSNMERYEIEFPANHPDFVLPSNEFQFLINNRKKISLTKKIKKKLRILFGENESY